MSKHVNLPLVSSKLADIGLKEENITGLHCRVQELRNFKFVGFLSSESLGTPYSSCNCEGLCDVHNPKPVVVSVFSNMVTSPEESDIRHLHACGLPDLYKVAAYHLDFVKITPHFFIEHGEPICHPEVEDAASINEFIDIITFHETLSNMHPSRWLKPIVAVDVLILLNQGIDVSDKIRSLSRVY